MKSFRKDLQKFKEKLTLKQIKPTIAIIGYGFVGKATSQLQKKYKIEIYDPNVEKYCNNFFAFEKDIVIVCVPTPTVNGEVDVSIVEDAILKWQKFKKANSILVIKSTIPAGTIERFCKKYSTNRIVHNPEFLTQRTANEDFMNPLEVIVGGDKDCSEQVIKMYKNFYNNSNIKYYCISSSEAELLKTLRNSFYATKVSFFNEVYELCNSIKIDYQKFIEVFTLNGAHPWVGSQHTKVPGPDGLFGFGGACLPKDSEGLLSLAKENNVDMMVLEAAILSNKRRRK